MKEILNNPLMKAFLNGAFKSYLKSQKLHGIYVSFDEKDSIQLTEFKTPPTNNDTTRDV